ncbi:MAG: GSCFA domain-containing protein [Cyclobacteriaceae bacterium]|nr:GSCFA domain-containing protein [Cyclobacteriaceae bacterium]
MNFRTVLRPLPAPVRIDLTDPVLTIGSCFADTMGSLMAGYKFNALSNPFGVSYNPHAIHKLLQFALDNQTPPPDSYLVQGDVHLNYYFHSSLSALTRQELELDIKNRIDQVHECLKNARWLMITYGTAWTYTRNDIGDIVSNCHKMPGSYFTKELFTQKKMLDSFQEFYEKLKALNKNIDIIITVSPVRHVRDTLELNSVSKSVLRLGCHTLAEQHKDVHYFPAYEIMLDDLRDYRFYKSDLIHPSDQAIEYIWQQFSTTWFTDQALAFINQWSNIKNALNHKPFHPATKAHQAFLRDLLLQLESMQNQVHVQQEIDQVKAQLL